MGLAMGGRDATSSEKGEKQTLKLSTPGLGNPHGEDKYPLHVGLKTSGAYFVEFLQSVGPNIWNFKNHQDQLWESGRVKGN